MGQPETETEPETQTQTQTQTELLRVPDRRAALMFIGGYVFLSTIQTVVATEILGQAKDLPFSLIMLVAYLYVVVISGLAVIWKRKRLSYLPGGDKYMYLETYVYSLIYTISLLGLQKITDNKAMYDLVLILNPIMIIVIDIARQNGKKNVLIYGSLVVVTIGTGLPILGLFNSSLDWIIGSSLGLLLAGRHLIGNNIPKFRDPITAKVQSNTNYLDERFLLINIFALFNFFVVAIFDDSYSLAEFGRNEWFDIVMRISPVGGPIAMGHFLYLICGNLASSLCMSIAYNLQHVFSIIIFTLIAHLSLSITQLISFVLTIVGAIGLIYFDTSAHVAVKDDLSAPLPK